MIAFAHEQTDWYEHEDASALRDALTVYVRIAQAIAYSQPVYMICRDKSEISHLFCSKNNISFIEIPTNDTWIRDYGYISVVDDGEARLLDFVFDGWGAKYEARLDNSVNRTLYKKGYLGTTPLESVNLVLEGGSIESDGEGTILTTSRCLCKPNRNGGMGRDEIEQRLEEHLGATSVLWLDHGYLAGDDTDSHIDTLARFVNTETIVYVNCTDNQDEHYEELQKMREELQAMRRKDGKPYSLIPLPMCEAKYSKSGDRLPATYANFLITNSAVLYPTYNDKSDKRVGEILSELFADREIIPINCLRLIEQGGSLHCSTMQVV